MDLLNKTKQICQLYNIKPSRSKGQNFLVNENIYDKIVAVAELKSDDVVLEVGPGLGFLTAKLAARAKKVVAVELDDKLAEVLKIAIKAQSVKNVEVMNENILDFDSLPQMLAGENKRGWRGVTPPHLHPVKSINLTGQAPLLSKEREYKIVANLPYNITSIFLRKFLSAEYKPSLMVLMLQKEVAERITAGPGKMSLLAVSVQFYALPREIPTAGWDAERISRGGPEIIQIVPKNNFWPAPRVDSAIVKLKPHPTPFLRKEREEKEFFRLVKIGFSARRKMLKNNLANGYHISHEEAEKWIKKAGFNGKIRAQELSVDNWIKILEIKSGIVV